MHKIDWAESGPLANWQKAVLAFARKTREALGDRVVHIILYGSRARGDYTDDSDIDVLIVVRGISKEEAEERLSWLAWEVLEEYEELLAEFVVTENEYEPDRERAFFINVKEEGVTV